MSYEPDSYDPVREPDAAKGRVTAPGIMLVINGIINVLFTLGLIGMGVFALTQPEEKIRESQEMTHKMFPNLPVEDQDPAQVRMTQMGEFFGGAAVAGLASLLMILGGAQMCRLRGYGLAVIAAILAMIPCVSCGGCFALGQVAGIWALMVLANPEVRSAFR
jgi:hypothetical protein